MPQDAKDPRAAFVASPICEPVAGGGDGAEFADARPGETRVPHGREHVPSTDVCDQPLFPRFRAALQAPGGPLGPARTARGPSPSPAARPPPAPAPRSRLAAARRALSYLCIIVGGTLTGLLLGHQLSPLGPEHTAADANRGQALAVTMPSRSSLGPSAVAKLRERPSPVLAHRLPRATATAMVASTAGTKGDTLRWRPEAALGPLDAPTAARAASADAGQGTFAALPVARPARTAEQSEAIDGALGRAFYQLAYSQQRQGDAKAAMASYERAGVLDPERAATWYNWGLLLEQDGAADGAIGKYVRAIRADRSHRFAWYNLGYLLQSRGDVDDAIRVYQRAIAVGAAHPLTFYNLGWLQQRRGQHELAAQLYREALALDPAHALARYNLGYLLERRGDAKGAAEQYRAVLEIEPDHALARDSLDRLDARRDRHVAAKEE